MKLVYYPDPVLRQPAEPVRHIDGQVRRVAAEMAEIMFEAKGLGLAAQQAGLTQSILVVNLTGEPGGEQAFVNPTIERQTGFVEVEEGCLSFPGLFAKIRRAQQVTVKAYDLDGNEVRIEAKDVGARLWLHETDHLAGILFIDRMGEVARLAAATRLKELETSYAKSKRRGEVA